MNVVTTRSDTMAQFSEFLYTLRKEKNLTQSELAEKLGITNKAVSKWETGEAMPDTAQLLPLSEIFGVSVDELLRGERNTAEKAKSKEDRIILTDGEDTVEIKSDGSIYINEVKREPHKRTLLEKIAGCVCGSLMAIAIIVYVSLGAVFGLWHPLWCIPASAALGCGIVCCTFDLFDRTKKAKTWKEGDNPYTGSLCGIIMCASLIIFLCVASVLNMWNIMWISPAAGGCACMILGAIGGVFSHKKEK